jgi:hypothetical protein
MKNFLRECADAGLCRMWPWLIVAVVTLAAIYVIAPQQVSVVLAKFNLLALGAWLGYWVDRIAFPYARPHEAKPAHVDVAQLRRALIIAAAMVAMALAL